jgi:F-type H+-transporting ATPase subunit b
MEIIKTNALITINETLWVQMIIFLVFLFLINRIMFRPVRRNLAEREDHFADLRRTILRLKEEMGTLLRETRAEERRLQATARRTVEELRQTGRQEADRLVDQALSDIKHQYLATEKQLKTSLMVARRQTEAEAAQLTTAIIQHLLDRRP